MSVVRPAHDSMDLLETLALTLPTPVSSQAIADAIVTAVREGTIAEGASLPSLRRLSGDLGVSPGTVALAYRILRERGVIVTSHGRKAQIAVRPAVPRPSIAIQMPDGVRDLTTIEPDAAFLPDPAGFVDTGAVSGSYRAPHLDATLEQAVRERFADDGIAGELTVGSGTLDVLAALLQSRLRPGDAVVVEDPTWPLLLTLLRTLGLEPVPVAVDDEGPRPDELARAVAGRRCAAIVVTPRAQDPFGSALSPARAVELRRILGDHPDLLVIENDYAALIADTPAVTLTAGREHWAVVRSMGVALGPDLRVAVTASDRGTADLVQARQSVGAGWVSHLLQRAVAKMLVTPEVAVRCADATRAYARRRAALLDALASRGIAAHARSGMNVAIPVPDEVAVVVNLALRGWGVRPGEAARLRTPPFVRVCVATLAPEDAERLAGDLDDILSTPAGRRRDAPPRPA